LKNLPKKNSLLDNEYFLSDGTLLQLNAYEEKKFGKTGYTRIKAGAKRRGLPFDIPSPESLIEWWINQPDLCYWCNRHARTIQRLTTRITQAKTDSVFIKKIQRLLGFNNNINQFLTYDRIDPGQGYNLDNIQKTCMICNAAKGLLVQPEDMPRVSEHVYQRIYKELKND